MKDGSLVKPGENTSSLYQKIYEILSDIAPRNLNNDILDIAFLQSGISLELQAHVVQHGKILFDDAPELRADYEAQVMLRMADMRPLINIMDKAILDRL